MLLFCSFVSNMFLNQQKERDNNMSIRIFIKEFAALGTLFVAGYFWMVII